MNRNDPGGKLAGCRFTGISIRSFPSPDRHLPIRTPSPPWGERERVRGVLIRTTAGTAGFLQAGCNLVAGAPVAFDKINLNGFDLFEKLPIDGKRNTIFLKNFIFRDWFIQNHAQRGPGSASLGQDDSDRRSLISLLEVIFHHFSGLLG